MVALTALWLPILLSAVAVFITSSIIHMVLNYHSKNFSELPGEDGIRDAFRKAGVGPGNYNVPHCTSMKDMQSPEKVKKLEEGPVGFFLVMPAGIPRMGKHLLLWFLYSIGVGIAVAYLAGRTLGAGVESLQLFRVTGTTAFLTYAGAEPVSSIWKGFRWSTTLKHMIDGLIYGLVTGGIFVWLWP